MSDRSVAHQHHPEFIMPRSSKSAKNSLLPETISAWNTLLERAELLRELAPWEVIDGDCILGVRDRLSGETDWCTIMGQGGDLFGVTISLGNAGLGSLQRLLADPPDEFDCPIQQISRVLTFNDRDLVSREMTAILKACGRRYRGADAWPELVVHDPGYFAVPPSDPVLLRRLTTVLDCLLMMGVQASQEPGWCGYDAQGRTWVAIFDSDQSITLTRETIPKIAVPPVPTVTVDEVAVARARALPKRPSSGVLIDWFVSNAVITGPECAGRPFYASHNVAFDADTGTLLGMDLGRLTTVWQDTAKLLLTVCQSTGVPARVLVRRQEALKILAPLAAALGTTLVHHPKSADMLLEFRDQIDALSE